MLAMAPVMAHMAGMKAILASMISVISERGRATALRPANSRAGHVSDDQRLAMQAGQRGCTEVGVPKPPSAKQVEEISVFVSSSNESEANHLREEIDRHKDRVNVILRESDQLRRHRRTTSAAKRVHVGERCWRHAEAPAGMIRLQPGTTHNRPTPAIHRS
jgi:hypothetical protein